MGILQFVLDSYFNCVMLEMFFFQVVTTEVYKFHQEALVFCTVLCALCSRLRAQDRAYIFFVKYYLNQMHMSNFHF